MKGITRITANLNLFSDSNKVEELNKKVEALENEVSLLRNPIPLKKAETYCVGDCPLCRPEKFSIVDDVAEKTEGQ